MLHSSALVVLLTVLSMPQAFAANFQKPNISIKISSNYFSYRGKNDWMCFIFTGYYNTKIIENPMVKACSYTKAARAPGAFLGARSWQNFRFMTDRFGHTWISEINLNHEFLCDAFQTLFDTFIRSPDTSFVAQVPTVRFDTKGLGETHITSYSEPFKVDLDWNSQFNHRPINFRPEDQRATVDIEFYQEQHFTADDDGIPIKLEPVKTMYWD